MPLDFEQAKQALKRVRDKYPQYSDMGDEELSKALADKYPQYKDIRQGIEKGSRISPEDVKRVARQRGISVERAKKSAQWAEELLANVKFGARDQTEDQTEDRKLLPDFSNLGRDTVQTMVRSGVAERTGQARSSLGSGAEPVPGPDTIVDVGKGILRGSEKFKHSIDRLVETGAGFAGVDLNMTGPLSSPEPETGPGKFAEPITQFAMGFALTGPALRSLGLVPKGKGLARSLGRGAIEGAGADFISFQGHEARLSDVIQQFPELRNPVTEFLAADEDDPELVGRIKNVMEGLALGGLIEGFLSALRGYKSWAKSIKKGGDATALRVGELAQASRETREAVMKETGIDPEGLLSPVESKILRDNPQLAADIVRRRQEGQRIDVGTRRGKPLIRGRGEPEPGVGPREGQEPGDVGTSRPAAEGRGPTPAGPSGREKAATGDERQITSSVDSVEFANPRNTEEYGTPQQMIQDEYTRFLPSGGRIPEIEFTPPRDVEQERWQEFARRLGNDLVYYNVKGTEDLPDEIPAGMVAPFPDNKIFVRASDLRGLNMANLVGHEIGHQLSRNHPEAYFKIGRLVKEDLSQFLSATRQPLGEEGVAEFVGQAFQSPSFWNRLKRRNNSLFRIVENEAKRVVGKAIEAATEAFGLRRFALLNKRLDRDIADIIADLGTIKPQRQSTAGESITRSNPGIVLEAQNLGIPRAKDFVEETADEHPRPQRVENLVNEGKVDPDDLSNLERRIRNLSEGGPERRGDVSTQPAGQGTGGIRSTLKENESQIWDLLDPEAPKTVRELSNESGKSVSAVRKILRKLVQKDAASPGVRRQKSGATEREVSVFTKREKEIRPDQDTELMEGELSQVADRTPIGDLEIGVRQMDDMLKRLESKPSRHLRVKDEFIKTVRDFLPKSEQGKVLSWYSRVKGSKSLNRAIERTRDILQRHRRDKSLRELKSAARTVDLARMREEFQQPILNNLEDAQVQVQGKGGTRLEPVIKTGKDGRPRLDHDRLVRWARQNDKSPEQIQSLREHLLEQSTRDRNTDKFLGLHRGQSIASWTVDSIKSVTGSRSPLRGSEFSAVPEQASFRTRAGRFGAQIIDQVTYDGFVHQLARGLEDQPIYQILSHGLQLGWRHKQRWFRQGEEQMIKAIRDHLNADWSDRKFHKYLEEQIDVPGTGRMTREEAMKLYALSRDEQVRQNLPNASITLERQPSRKMTVDDLDNVESVLTEAERGFVDSVKSFWSGPIWNSIQNTHRQIKGFDLRKIRGYEPVRRGKLDETSELFDVWSNFERQTLDNLNLQKPRTGGDRRPYVVRGFITDYLDHLEQASRYSSLAIPVRDAQALLNNQSLRDAITSRYGRHGLDFVEQGIRHVMGFKNERQALVERIITALARNFAASRLVFNVGSAAKQYFALLTNFADDVNTDGALFQALRENSLFDSRVRQRMERLSPEAYHRFNHSFISQLFSGGIGPKKKTFWTDLQEKGFVLQRTADKQTLSALWRASEIDVAREMGVDPSRAIAGKSGREFTERVTDRFETALAREQATDNPTQLSWFDMRARESPAWRMATLFRRELNRVYNTMRRPIVRAINNPSRENVQKALKAGLVLGPGLAVGEHLVNEGRDVALSGGRIERRNVPWSVDQTLDLTEGLFGRLYAVGDFAGFLNQMARGNRLFAVERLNSPLVSLPKGFWNFGSQIAETAYRMNGEKIERGVRRGMTNTTQEVFKTIEDFFDFAGPLGLPGWAIANQGRRLYEWTETDLAKMVNFERRLRRLKDEKEDAFGSRKRQLTTQIRRMESANRRINSIHRQLEKGNISKERAHSRIVRIIEQAGE